MMVCSPEHIYIYISEDLSTLYFESIATSYLCVLLFQTVVKLVVRLERGAR